MLPFGLSNSVTKLNNLPTYICKGICSKPKHTYSFEDMEAFRIKIYCEGVFHDELRFSFLNFNRLVESLQNFEYEYNY